MFSLLIKIMQKLIDANHNNNNIDIMDKTYIINIFALKPLKNLHTTCELLPNREDRNLSRALYELFYFAEKLAQKWSIQDEYRARMKDREEILEKLCETSFFIQMIIASLNMQQQRSSVVFGASRKKKVRRVIESESEEEKAPTKLITSSNDVDTILTSILDAGFSGLAEGLNPGPAQQNKPVIENKTVVNRSHIIPVKGKFQSYESRKFDLLNEARKRYLTKNPN